MEYISELKSDSTVYQPVLLDAVDQVQKRIDTIWKSDWNPQVKAYIISMIEFLAAKTY